MSEYPSDKDLRAIRNWDYEKGWGGFLDLVDSAWNHTYGTIRKSRRYIRFITGGWSGNEDIIGAMSRNFIFQSHWYKSERGGYHVYEMPTKKRLAPMKESR